MPITPEDRARQIIDRLLEAAGWKIQHRKDADLSQPGGVAVREFPMPGFGEADYLLFVDGQALGVVEAKREGETLTHVERQTEKYSVGLPDFVVAPVKNTRLVAHEGNGQGAFAPYAATGGRSAAQSPDNCHQEP